MDLWLKSGLSVKRKNNDDESNEGTPCSSETIRTHQRKQKKRKYCDEYLAFGFTCTGLEDEQKPQCVLCYELLSNECMKPAKLRRHLETKHKEYTNKSVEFFQNKEQELRASKKLMKKTATGCNNEKAVFASYQVSLLIAKKGKPHTIAEELILPAAKVMTCAMLGDKAAKDLNLISLSNDTVKRRIEEMSENIKEQLIIRVRKSQYYSLQLDESTDVSNNANLLAFIRYEFESKINEDFLFCCALTTRTTAEAVFNSLNDFITSNEIEWSTCVGISTDGARAMSGKYTGLLARVQAIIPSVTWNHCCIHRESLAARKMPEKLKTTLDEVVKVVNFIKARPLNSRIFNTLCQEMGSNHKQLLLHSEVRWLSRGKVLNRLFELRDEIRIFFIDTTFPLSERFNDFSWLAMVAYLADIFTCLNGLNLSLQGVAVTIFKVEDRVEAMIKKLDLWSNRLSNRLYESFPTLNDFLETADEELSDEIRNVLIQHLQDLKRSFRDYFPLPDFNKSWIRDPFNIDVNSIKSLTSLEENSLVELSCDSSLKLIFNQYNLTDFWLRVRPDYAELSIKALKHLMPFPTTYLCEQAFSALFYVKSKYRNRLIVEPDLRIQLSTIEPNICNLVSAKQHHSSH